MTPCGKHTRNVIEDWIEMEGVTLAIGQYIEESEEKSKGENHTSIWRGREREWVLIYYLFVAVNVNSRVICIYACLHKYLNWDCATYMLRAIKRQHSHVKNQMSDLDTERKLHGHTLQSNWTEPRVPCTCVYARRDAATPTAHVFFDVWMKVWTRPTTKHTNTHSIASKQTNKHRNDLKRKAIRSFPLLNGLLVKLPIYVVVVLVVKLRVFVSSTNPDSYNNP